MTSFMSSSHRWAILAGVALAAAALPSLSALGVDPDREPDQYVRRSWTLAEGLPQSSVNDVVQDRRGYLWIATHGGLARFDGVRFAVYTRSEHPGLPSDRLTALALDADGTLWIGSERSGLARLRDGVVEAFTPPDGLPIGAVTRLHVGPGGDLWIGSEDGLVRHGPAGWHRFGTADGLPHRRVESIAETPEGDVWVGTLGGLARLQGDRLEPALEAEIGGRTVFDLHRDRSGAIWIAAGTHLLRWRDGAVEEIPVLGGGTRVRRVLEDGDGNVWLGYDVAGLWRLSADGSTAPASDSRPADSVLALLEGREGTLLIGTAGNGLVQLKDGAAISFGGPGSPLGTSTVPIVDDAAGGVWVGLNCGGVVHLDADGGTTFVDERQGLTNTCVWSLDLDADGRLWIGTMGKGLHVHRDGEVVLLAGPPSRDRRVQVLYRDRSGVLLVGTDGGVYRVVPGGDPAPLPAFAAAARFEPLPGSERLYVQHLSEDADGRLWIGSLDGVWVYDRNAAAPLRPAAPLPAGSQVRAVHHDARGVAWFGTYGHGLFRFDGERLAAIGRRHGLREDIVSAIFEDDRGRFWLTGNRGVYRIPRGDLDAVAAGGRDPLRVEVFDTADGMISAECNGGGQPAGTLTADGLLWVPTLDGVARFDTRAAARRWRPPQVSVESVSLDGAAIDPRRPAGLPAGSRNLEIRYAAPSFTDPDGVRFRYRMGGEGDHWVDAGHRRVAYYPYLPPGRHRFEVAASHGEGNWGEAAGFTLTVDAGFADSAAPWALALLLVASLIAAAVALRLRAVRRRERRLADEVAARTAELRAAQGELEAANSRLEKLVRIDPLTGAPNRRSLMERLDAEWRRAVRSRRPLGLLMVDIDQFKRYNDLHGHPPGDDCLRRVAGLLASGLRRADEMLARYGGEEMAAIVPETSAAELADLAEALRRRVETAGLPHGDSPLSDVVTVSIGGAVVVPGDGDTPGSLLVAADSALYAAKQGGRNRVETVDLGTPDSG